MAVWLEDMIIDLIGEKCSVLEIGCGPGALACRLADKCSKVTAIDISERMIEYANRKKNKGKMDKVEFICMAAAQLSAESRARFARFDYTVSAFCLHEMEPQQRSEAVENCLMKSDKMIIADYMAPFPKSLVGIGNTIMEKLAGKSHYQNFCDWQASGGIDGFVEGLGLKMIYRMEWKDHCGKTIVVST
jgi:SAM-dependent methyltransferase